MASVSTKAQDEHDELLRALDGSIDTKSTEYSYFIKKLKSFNLPDGRLDRVKNDPMKVFDMMTNAELLGVGNYDLLEKAIDYSGPKVLMTILQERKQRITDSMTKEEEENEQEQGRAEEENEEEQAEEENEEEQAEEKNEEEQAEEENEQEQAEEENEQEQVEEENEQEQDGQNSCLPQNIIDTVPSEKHLSRLSTKISKNFVQLGIELGVPSAKIDHIKMENPAISEQIFKILREWLQRDKSQATFRNLEEACKHVGIDTSILNEVL